MGVWFGANGQVGGSGDGEEDPKEARREAATSNGSPGSQKSSLEVPEPAFPRYEVEKSQKRPLEAKMAGTCHTLPMVATEPEESPGGKKFGLSLPNSLSRFLHLDRRFWNHTWGESIRWPISGQMNNPDESVNNFIHPMIRNILAS